MHVDRTLPIVCLALLLACTVGDAPAQTQSLTVQASRDNTLYEQTEGSISNGAGEHFFVGRTRQGALRRGVIAFDVAGSLPAGATIDEVKLKLNMSRTTGGATAVTLYRLLSDWGEGSSDAGQQEGSGAAATNGDATWIHTFFPDAMWATPGGDFATAPSASVEIGDQGRYTWGSTAEMVTDVQQWLDQPETNFGWILIGDEQTDQSAKRFDSRQHADDSTWPELEIDYSVATASEDDDVPAGGPRLSGTFPNPLATSATIAYDLAAPTAVRLELFDLLGRSVSVLVDAQQGAGPHRVVWDATDARGNAVSSGLYLARLRTPHGIHTITLTVIR